MTVAAGQQRVRERHVMTASHPYSGPQEAGVEVRRLVPDPPHPAGSLVLSHRRDKIIYGHGPSEPVAVLIQLAEQAGLSWPRHDRNPHESDCLAWH